MRKAILLSVSLLCLTCNGQVDEIGLVSIAVKSITTMDEAILKRKLCTAVLQVMQLLGDVLTKGIDCEANEFNLLRAKYQDAAKHLREYADALGEKCIVLFKLVEDNHLDYDQLINFWTRFENGLKMIIGEVEFPQT